MFLRNAETAGDRFWLTVTLAATAIASVTFLVVAFRSGLAIQDDAPMFLSWTPRWDDPALLHGDLLADYWSSVTPWFYRAVYHTAWTIGVDPVAFAKILPPVLFLLLAFFAYRFFRAIGSNPVIACVVTLIVVHGFIHNGSVVSAAPRAFAPILLLAVLDGLARKSTAQVVLAQLFLAGSYPQVSIVTATVIGMSMIAVKGRLRLDLGRARLLLVGLAAAATIAGLTPFALTSGRYGPATTLEEARLMPTFQPGGRESIFEPDGSIDRICGYRGGLIGRKCGGLDDPGVWIFAFLACLGPAVLFLRARRGSVKASSPLPLYLSVASLLWSVAAAASLFRLHLANSYSQNLIVCLLITIGPLTAEWLWHNGKTVFGGKARLVGVWALVFIAGAGMVTVRVKMKPPQSPELIAAIASLPKDAVVAGFVSDLDFVPILAPRSVLFNRELSVALHAGYFREITARMQAMRDVYLVHDAAVMADRLERYDVDKLLIEQQALDAPAVPQYFRGFFGADLLDMEKEARAGGSTAVARLAPACKDADFDGVIMLDAGCLIRGARAAP